jgi:5'-3' exonuclease
MAEPRVLLVDASPYIFRAHFALPSSLVDRTGRPSSAVYGFGGFLLKLLEDESPTHLAVAFDRSLSTSFRNDLYPPYKQQRELPPADLEAQLDDCQALAHALGAAALADDRYEADDLIGSLCDRLRVPATVVTSDKDLAQLVDERVDWLDYARGRRYDAAAVGERFGVAPERIPDLLGLAGDPVDNIPGVRGIGAKTAVALLGRFPSLEALCERAGEVAALDLRGAARLSRLLAEQAGTALLSKRLATVARDAPVPGDLEALRLRGPRRAVLDALFERLGFDSLHERFAAL